MAPWQRITVYRYTLPPPYELAIEHLFEELPLSTYPSGTTVEPLAYEMDPGAHLGRATTSNHALVLFPGRAPTQGAVPRETGLSFREACDRGYLRPYAPKRVLDSCQAALKMCGIAARGQHEERLPGDQVGRPSWQPTVKGEITPP